MNLAKILCMAIFILLWAARPAEIQADQSPQGGVGIIEGSLGYPAEEIPKDMVVCAVGDAGSFCTNSHLKGEYTYKLGYRLEVPVGDYLVYASTEKLPGYRAYYSEFVTCNLMHTCQSHQPILVRVRSGDKVINVDPQDWYKKD